MESIRVECLDHLGVLSEVIKDLGLIERIDARLVPDEQEEITPGEAVSGMILNSLGFSNRPLSLTPQQDLGIFAEVHTEVGDMIVASVNIGHVRELLNSEGVELKNLIAKSG
jgi:hypothetical protein